jgi:hypothetical protein
MSSRSTPKLLTIITALVSLACLTVAARAWMATAMHDAANVAAASATQPVTAQTVATGLPIVRVTIKPTGFDPSEVTIPQGRFILAIDNRTGLRELTFRLDREGAGRLREVRMPRERTSYREVIDPQPGAYILTEADHTDWVCRINVSE